MSFCSGPSEQHRLGDAAAHQISDAIDVQLKADEQAGKDTTKLLLLGPPNVGKRTLVKQAINMFGKGFPLEERRKFVPHIHAFIISTMKRLCAHCPLEDPQLLDIKLHVEQLKGNETIDLMLALNLQALWMSAEIQSTYKALSENSAGHFLDRIEEVCRADYLPSEQDVLRTPAPRTSGLPELEFVMQGKPLRIVDTGGQKNERKKWIHCFEHVSAVLFMVSLTDYDQTLPDDPSVNRLQDTIELFGEICNTRWFKNASIVLILNKRDLFTTKLQSVSLAQSFPEYRGAGDDESAYTFIRQQFESKNRDPKDRHVWVLASSAVDERIMGRVFQEIHDAVVPFRWSPPGLI